MNALMDDNGESYIEEKKKKKKKGWNSNLRKTFVNLIRRGLKVNLKKVRFNQEAVLSLILFFSSLFFYSAK